MDKYTKGALGKIYCEYDRVFWTAIISTETCDGYVAAVEVHGDTKKEAKRLRKKIMDALNEQGDKEDDITYQDDANAIDELNKDADNILKDYISQLIEKMFDFSKKDKDEMKERWFNDTKISKK